MNPHSARSYETDTKSSCGSEVRPKLPFAVLGLLGQSNRGRLKRNLRRPTPAARSHMPIQHNAVFAKEKKPRRRGRCMKRSDSKTADVPKYGPNRHTPFQVCLAKQTAAVRKEIYVVQLQLDYTCPYNNRPFFLSSREPPHSAGDDKTDPNSRRVPNYGPNRHGPF